MKIALKATLATVLCLLLLTAPALAGDLRVSINAADNTLSISNLLSTPVYIMDLGGAEKIVDLNVEVPAGGTVTVPNKGLTSGINGARCLAGAAAGGKIPGKQPFLGEFYYLTVDVY